MNKILYTSLWMLLGFGMSFAQSNFSVTVGGASLSFSPANLTITAGDSVTWTNAGGSHNVNGTQTSYPSNPESFGNSVGTGWTYGYRFNTPGTYDYRCDPHFGANMVGTITVQAAAASTPVYDIATVSTEDANGVADSLTVECELRGVVYSEDFRGGTGIQFYMKDATGGINVFSFSDVSGYTVQVGDSIHVIGEIIQFRGLIEIDPDSIALISSGNSTGLPTIVTDFNEGNEGNFVKIEKFYLIDTAQWSNSGSGFNVDVTNGSDTLVVRIDNESFYFGATPPRPNDTLSFSGAVTQFASTAPPHIGAFQMLPSTVADVILLNADCLPIYPIAVVHTEANPDGFADSLNVECEIRGVVHSIDFDGNNGYSFYIADNTGFINVFNFSDVSGYQVSIGDSIHAIGSIAQFNGLTEIQVDSIALASQGNSLNAPLIVTELNEDNESFLVTFENAYIVDPATWTNAGFGFNADFTDGNDTLSIRIDADTDVFGLAAPAATDTFTITGIATQFDVNGPFLDSYQILPRFRLDFDTLAFTAQQPVSNIPVYPIALVSTEDASGVADSLNVECELRGVVYSEDFRGGTGLQFYMKDTTGGINVFDFNDVSGYAVQVGDSLHITGTIIQFRGLIEISPDSIELISSGNITGLPEIVTELNEANEGNFVKIEKFYLLDTTQWTNAGSGFNVDVTNGPDTLVVRIDNESFYFGTPAPRPTDTLNFSGAASQFASTAPPHIGGFQLLPSTVADVIYLNRDCLPVYPIAVVHTENNADAVADSNDVVCEIRGVVHSIDFDGDGGYSFYIADNTGFINVFDFNDKNGYQVTLGDSIHAIGDITQFNGLTEIQVDSIALISQGNVLDTPIVVTEFNEGNEAFLVTIENFYIVNPADWSTSGSFNAPFTNGSDTLTVRIDSDTDIFGLAAPAVTDTFNLTGIVTQFDRNAPFLESYQLLPRFRQDIDTLNASIPAPVDTIPFYTIGIVSTEDADGVADSLNVECELRGVVTSVDFDGDGGISFYMEDPTGAINVFNFIDISGYQATIGDSIHVFGGIIQFRGLTEIQPDSINLISQGNAISAPVVVTALDESTESVLVTLEDVFLVEADTALWTNPTGSFNFRVYNAAMDTFVVRVDSDVTLFGTPRPGLGDTLTITGIGSQFDGTTAPFLGGYQMLPRFVEDFVVDSLVTSLNPGLNTQLSIYPNPARTVVTVEAEGIILEQVSLVDVMGRVVMTVSVGQRLATLDVARLQPGVYTIVIATRQGLATSKVVIKR